MIKTVSYKTPDGVIHVMFPAPFARRQVVVTPVSFERVVTEETETSAKRYDCEVIPAETRDETDDELVAWVALKDVPLGVDFKIAETPFPMADEDLPAWFDDIAGDVVGQGQGYALDDTTHENLTPWMVSENSRMMAEQSAIDKAHSDFIADLTADNEAEHEAWLIAAQERIAIEESAAAAKEAE